MAFLILFILLMNLGNWQLNRAAEKARQGELIRARTEEPVLNLKEITNFSTAEFLYRRIKLAGHYINDHQYLLDNRTLHGVAGFHVVTPFILDQDDRIVLVNRGWIPLHAREIDRIDINVSSVPTMINGTVKPIPKSFLLDEEEKLTTWPRIVQALDLGKFETELQLDVIPVLVELDPRDPGGYSREWSDLTVNKDRHMAYAVQWFAMAILLVILYLGFAHARARSTS